MAQMTIDCPKCNRPLIVPDTAAGRKGRCKVCEARFLIPSAATMLEETISHLILDELDHRWHKHDVPGAESSSGRAPSQGSPSDSGTVMAVPVASQNTQQHPDKPGEHWHVDDLSAGRDGAATRQPPPEKPAAQPANPSEAKPDAAAPPQPPPPAQGEPHAQSAPAETADDSAASDAVEAAYPQELCPSAPRPYLVVREVTRLGVHLAFDAQWVEHETFCTAMPMRCALTGKQAKDRLVSRPMIFANRHDDGELSHDQPRAIETQYEQTVQKGHSPRQHRRAIGRLRGMKPPFNHPVLYYASAQLASDALECRVRTTDSRRQVCEVFIPNGAAALEWLSRVNGRCGPEYARLKVEVAQLHSNAWRSLPEHVRKRIAVWCHLGADEQFVLYLNEADLTATAAGLGGVVITSQRLIYHKFRSNRSISLEQNAVLHVRSDEAHARLTLESQGRMARVGKIHRSDVNRLIDALSRAPRLRVMVSNQQND